jgi:hypothetical protein
MSFRPILVTGVAYNTPTGGVSLYTDTSLITEIDGGQTLNLKAKYPTMLADDGSGHGELNLGARDDTIIAADGAVHLHANGDIDIGPPGGDVNITPGPGKSVNISDLNASFLHQTTVGAPGSAAILPVSPDEYLLIDGFAVPAFAPS